MKMLQVFVLVSRVLWGVGEEAFVRQSLSNFRKSEISFFFSIFKLLSQFFFFQFNL